MIVLIGGEKGGTGKSTISTSLAAMRAGAGHDVLLVDTDSQSTSAMWAGIRAEEGVEPAFTTVRLTGRGLADELRKLSARFKDIVVDAGGRDSVELRQAMLVANIMIVPSRPSTFDMLGFGQLDEIVEAAMGFNPEMQAKVVINYAPTHAASTATDDMRQAIGELKNLQVMNAMISERVAFQRAASRGKAVTENEPKDAKAIAEITGLYDEIFGAAP